MAINLVTKFLPYVDEMFTTESKKSVLTNQDFIWTGAHTVKVYKVSTSDMNDYDRKGTGSGATGSRYGVVGSLDATTEELTLKKDRSFTFAIDKMDADETGQQLAGASTLERQQREVIIPEVDKYVYGVMCEDAGTKPSVITLTENNIYDEILNGNNALDNAEVPETNRVLVVTPNVYKLMKKCPDIEMETDIAQEIRLKGVIAMIDGLTVIKVPAVRLANIRNSIMQLEVYKEFEICSEQAAFEQIRNGTFVSAINAGSEIEIGQVSLDYMLDTKGFYQPIYTFDIRVEGEVHSIQIPAIK